MLHGICLTGVSGQCVWDWARCGRDVGACLSLRPPGIVSSLNLSRNKIGSRPRSCAACKFLMSRLGMYSSSAATAGGVSLKVQCAGGCSRRLVGISTRTLRNRYVLFTDCVYTSLLLYPLYMESGLLQPASITGQSQDSPLQPIGLNFRLLMQIQLHISRKQATVSWNSS